MACQVQLEKLIADRVKKINKSESADLIVFWQGTVEWIQKKNIIRNLMLYYYRL